MEEEIWQQYQILKEGKSQIVRRKNGPRLNNTIVYHLIGHEITTAQINTLEVSWPKGRVVSLTILETINVCLILISVAWR